MKISDLIQVKLKKGRGEFAGPCPFCGGDDRFITWTESGKTGAFWCRGCKRRGDGLKLLRELQGLTFLQAVDAWGLTPEDFPRTGRPKEKRVWTPKEKNGVPAEWSNMAEIFLEESEYRLLGNPEIREWLQGRGLKFETIRAARLGWNPKDEFFTRTLWGLDPATNEKGKPIRTYLKAGLIIPHILDGKIIGLKIRKANPDTGGRYTHVAGSDASPMIWGRDKETLLVVESELDGFLLHQEAGDLAGIIALGSAQARPDQENHQVLKEAGLILVALDTDAAGVQEAWGWWKKHYPNAKRWPVPKGIGKDPTEALQKGLNLRAWVRAGLPNPEPSTTTPEPTSSTIPAQEQATDHQEPPQATPAPGE
ncbi:MAG: zinc-binding protein, partial [Deltaproteobacteria bacterium]|nr:zinc-binding protein [Deltaproteobacteria bacterium]